MNCQNCPSRELNDGAALYAENCKGAIRFESGPINSIHKSGAICRAEAAVIFEEEGSFVGLRIVDVELSAEQVEDDNIIDIRIKHAVELAFIEVGIAGA